MEDCVITSEEAYSCEEPEETIVLLAKVWRHSCHARNHPSFQGLRPALPASCGHVEAWKQTLYHDMFPHAGAFPAWDSHTMTAAHALP